MARLSIELSNGEHKAIKSMAAVSGKSIRAFVIDLLFNDEPDQLSGRELTLKTMRELKGKDVNRYKNVDAMIADIYND